MVGKRSSNALFTNLQIETERLFIRPYQLEDLHELFEAVSDPDFYTYIPEGLPSLEEIEGIIKWSIDCNQKNSIEKLYKLNLVVIHKEFGKVIGFCGLGPYDLDASKVETYYGISKVFRGTGIATEAAKEVLRFGFDVLQLKEIVTTVFPENQASIHVLNKIGMKYRYTLKGLSAEYKDFEGYDYYTITREAYGA
jgi:[ribosomal protein S5]-alanine N-acetyltransferase